MLAVIGFVGLQHFGIAQSLGNLRVLAPKNGESLTTDFVDVRFELANPAVAAASTPNFRLQLDTSTPVNTTDTEYTFTGLKPGPHAIAIQLVDANGTPIPGSSATVKFKVVAQGTPRAAAPETRILAASLVPVPDRERSLPNASRQNPVPDNRGALPLLSLIGFGVLAGGIVSALKTR
jgi:hypothetical protein